MGRAPARLELCLPTVKVMKEVAKKMNRKNKAVLILCLLLLTLTFVTGCAEEESPYQINDRENFTVSVKYDANGGTFTTNTSVIVDSYDISGLTGSDGTARIALLPTDDPARGNDAFTAVNSGYFLAGWYAGRTETTDAAGNTVFTYSDPWDFETDRLEVDGSQTYTASEPVLTLYAAWVPLFEIEFYDLATGDYLESYTFNPTTAGEIRVPAWDTDTGAIEMYDFPERSGYTFNGAYYDAAGTLPVDTDTVAHTGTVNYGSGTAENAAMKLYVDWMEGEWYHIYNVEQFLDNASVAGNYVIHADLDFEGEIWPTSLMYGSFTGTIQADGHTFRNIEVTQTNNSKVNAGLFGSLAEGARITDLNLENVTFTIQSGTRVTGTSYGLLAGTISAGAVVDNVTIAEGTLAIDSGCYFGTEDYVIGLVCGMGSVDVDASGITCAAVGDQPESVVITVDGETVTVEFLTE